MPQVLLLLKGPPGSGKSTLGRALAGRLAWPLIDKDDARDAMQATAGSGPDVDWNALSYDVMFRYSATQLACGLSAIVDCPLARRSLYDRAAALAAQHDAHVRVVECAPGDEWTWRQQLEERGRQDKADSSRAHKPGSWSDLQAILHRNAGSEAWSDELPSDHCLRLNSTSLGLEGQVAAVVRWLTAEGLA